MEHIIQRFMENPRHHAEAFKIDGEVETLSAQTTIDCMDGDMVNEIMTLLLEGKPEQARAMAVYGYRKEVNAYLDYIVEYEGVDCA